MQYNLEKKNERVKKLTEYLKRIEKTFSELGTLPVMILKYGMMLVLGLIFLSAVLLLLNKNLFHESEYLNFIGNSMFSTSFEVLFAVVAGSLVFDHMSKRIE